MRNIFKNSQIRLLISGTLFAVAFVWMAISSYDVDDEVIRVFLIMSVILVAGLILSGFLFSLLIRVLRPKDRGFLDELERKNKSSEQDSE